jgi:hypothetical protein
VSNFDRTDCLAGCEERWGPGGREVDGRRMIFMGPIDGSVYLCSLEVDVKNKTVTRPFGTGANKQTNFDRTRCLAGCEERRGPGGREVDGRRVIL